MIKKYKDNLYLIDKKTLKRFMKADVTIDALTESNVDDLPCYDIALDDYFEDEKKIDPNYSLNTHVNEWINRIDGINNNELNTAMKDGE